jgi:nicotinate-nucleotide pyrophosphorylase (carboxylating)
VALTRTALSYPSNSSAKKAIGRPTDDIFHSTLQTKTMSATGGGRSDDDNDDGRGEQGTAGTTRQDFSALLPPNLDSVVRGWLADDVPSFDVGGLVVGTEERTAELYMKSSGVFAGRPFFQLVFDILGCRVEWTTTTKESGSSTTGFREERGGLTEGDGVQIAIPGERIRLATVTGPVRDILRGERTALNTLSRCSGVATLAREASDRARSLGWAGWVAGTRKTTPGFRVVEKYGLLVGGAATHRLDLSQMVMLKDNHVWSCGSIERAVKLARLASGFSQKIEVECQSLDEALEAARAGADIVMLDNFSPEQLRKDAHTFKQQHPNVLVEASGGITAETLPQFLCPDVDIVSQGNLTQGYPCVDFSLKIVH